jgi:hypothetical protein
MAGDVADDAVVLGLDTAAWAFAPADQTRPALAARVGALFDTTLAGERVTGLRIHGVSGSDGPTMQEHPTALQVAGDAITGFSCGGTRAAVVGRAFAGSSMRIRGAG